MSEKAKVIEAANPTSFAYRCIKKDFTQFDAQTNITPNFHLELGENYETKVVEDHADDWFEMTQKDAGSVGIQNIIANLEKLRENAMDGRFAFKDEEALDLGDVNPMDPESIKATISSGSVAMKKLEGTATQLGISVDELVDRFVKGTLAELISSKTATTEEGDTK